MSTPVFCQHLHVLLKLWISLEEVVSRSSYVLKMLDKQVMFGFRRIRCQNYTGISEVEGKALGS